MVNISFQNATIQIHPLARYRQCQPESLADLQEAKQAPEGEDRDAHIFCQDLFKYGGHVYSWGYMAYRTACSPACANDDFDKAMEVLTEYVRYSCFMEIDYNGNGDPVDYSDDKPGRQLWQHFRNHAVQDRSTLDGASLSDIRRLAKRQIKSQGAKVSQSSRHRFFLIIDEEVVRNLLRLPVPILEHPDACRGYSAKVLDIEFHKSQLDPDFQNGVDIYEGWCWVAAWKLIEVWFLCRDLDATELMGFDDEHRPRNRIASV